MYTTEEIIEKLRKEYNMVPLEKEGGLYVQTHCSKEILPAEVIPGRDGDHPMHTTILYLLKGNGFSRMHRLPTDETFHFYLGDPVEQLQLYPDGTGKVFTMGQDVVQDQLVQLMVPKNAWQGTRLAPGSKWALLGTTMAPGYLDIDYEDGNKEKLQAEYPQFKELLDFLAGEHVTE